MTPAQIEQFLNDLATKLTPAAQHVYDLAVRQAFITGIIDLGTGLGALVLMVILLLVAKYVFAKSQKWVADENEHPSAYGYNHYKSVWDSPFTYAAITLLITSGCLLLVAYPELYQGLLYILNPEWQALQQLASVVPHP